MNKFCSSFPRWNEEIIHLVDLNYLSPDWPTIFTITEQIREIKLPVWNCKFYDSLFLIFLVIRIIQFITVTIVHNEQKNFFVTGLSTLAVRIFAVLQSKETSGGHCSSNLQILKKNWYFCYLNIY